MTKRYLRFPEQRRLEGFPSLRECIEQRNNMPKSGSMVTKSMVTNGSNINKLSSLTRQILAWQLSWQSRGLKILVSVVQFRPEPPSKPSLTRGFFGLRNILAGRADPRMLRKIPYYKLLLFVLLIVGYSHKPSYLSILA